MMLQSKFGFGLTDDHNNLVEERNFAICAQIKVEHPVQSALNKNMSLDRNAICQMLI